MIKRKNNICPLCHQGVKYIDPENTTILQNFISGQFSILSARRTNLCRRHQKKITKAIKQARFLALLPFIRK